MVILSIFGTFRHEFFENPNLYKKSTQKSQRSYDPSYDRRLRRGTERHPVSPLGRILTCGGLLKKSQIFADWPGIKKKELFEQRDLNSTLDARAIYCSAMSLCFDTDFELLNKHVFPDKNLTNVRDKIFNS